MALRCLFLLFSTLKNKRIDDEIPYLYNVIPVSYLFCYIIEFMTIGLIKVTMPMIDLIHLKINSAIIQHSFHITYIHFIIVWHST